MTVVALLILAASGPHIRQLASDRMAEGLDIILVLDISGSMSARDFAPLNRLQAAKAVLREFIAKERTNRLGLVAFAARAFTVCPLTLDYPVLLTLLNHLEIGMTTDGTAIGMAIAAGLNRLKSSEAAAKVMILLTDGRNNAGQLEPGTAAEIAASLGIRIYTIGMGLPGGGAILIKQAGQGESVLLNADGSVHMEAVDEDGLQKIAEQTGGKYFRATDKDKLKAIYAEIRHMENRRLKSREYTGRYDLAPWLLLASLVLLGSEILGTALFIRRTP